MTPNRGGRGDRRIPILYLAPWIDLGGSDKNTIDWFRWLDRERFRPSLITTLPGPNRRLSEVEPYADEIWTLPDLLAGNDHPRFIFDFIESRGVEILHIMNSRLGFELLPDLAALPRPPATVVQLHVEEQDKSGYVRYVTTRYGNLVDGFSVVGGHVADAVVGYGASPSRVHVIYGGVDAEEEFSPDRVAPVDGLEEGPVHVLYLGRLVEQKNPLLMVAVAERLRSQGVREFRIHVVGDGDLEHEVRQAVAEAGLEDVVLLHGSTREPAPWYSACDVLLMTSVFEGVPYVVYESMAMEVPIVAPALAGNVEVMGEEAGTLIDSLDDPDAYVKALRRYIEDDGHRRAVGAAARERALQRFGLRQMAERHEQLYENLLENRRPRAPTASADEMADNGHAPGAVVKPIRFRDRPSSGTPQVSVVVPCYNHGRYLRGCLESIAAQSYPGAIETIVVDDASTEDETLAALAELERDGEVRLLRRETNGGPSRARNAAVAVASGRYILPVDADNQLLPHTVERLVAQLQAAGERVGFIYQNLRYFGNRTDFFQVPSYNLALLLETNFCDTCALIDRDVFEAGFRYADDMTLGHEDWDFVLQLANRDVIGEPARETTLLYRKWGFTRSEVVEYQREAPKEVVAKRHPGLYHPDRRVAIKARSAPALSLVALTAAPQSELKLLADRVSAQTLLDMEYVAPRTGHWPTESGPPVRLYPAALASDRAEALATGLEAARGRWLVLAAGSGADLLEDPAACEKLLRNLLFHGGLDVVALADAGSAGRYPLRLIEESDTRPLEPHTLALRRPALRLLPDPPELLEGAELGSISRALDAAGARMIWRHHPSKADALVPSPIAAKRRGIRLPEPARAADRAEHEMRQRLEPILPGLAPDYVRRWRYSAAWMPPETVPLCRHRHLETGERLMSNDRIPPTGWALEFDLGSIRKSALQGTTALLLGEELLGYLETAPLPLFEGVHAARLPGMDREFLVSGSADPLIAEVELVRFLGYIEQYPIPPRTPPYARRQHGVKGLLRAVDYGARRHVAAVDSPPRGERVSELGALLDWPQGGTTPLWIDARGRVTTEDYQLADGRPDARTTVRWVVAPATWGLGRSIPPRARAVARRALGAGRVLTRRSGASPDRGDPAGWLFREGGHGRLPLYSAQQAVTGDQFLTRFPMEAADMGYTGIELLGWMLPRALVTGTLDLMPTAAPWARHFGQKVRME
jgi:glycosyltransferase involved in cell wall biosynthesis